MATSTARVLGARSSLVNHNFPTFYACYLLKSMKPPLSSKATYIGSSPDPPRRIRQHNGELKAGARRTAPKRPWVMQMIVHGFPSKLAALQFEWAWQHPQKSRHFRDEDGRIFGNRGTKRIEKLIKIVRTMITRPPFNAWPLHVKLFTEEAVKIWHAASAAKRAPVMPSGFTCSIELEGVDGKSGHSGSGRKGPIDIYDSEFTNPHLAKHISLLASQRRLECSICHKPMHSYATDPLLTSLCPSLHCIAVSHLSCLSQHFLSSEGANKQKQSEFVPRGGNCKACRNYILWGDVIRGSYRRLRAMKNTQDGADNVDEDLFVSDEDDLSEADEDGFDETPIKAKRDGSTSRSRRKSTGKKTTKRVSSKRRDKSSSSSGESFDFNNISSSSENEAPTVRRRGRPPKTVKLSSHLVSPGSRKQSAKTPGIDSVRRGVGRPRKEASSIQSRVQLPNISPVSYSKGKAKLSDAFEAFPMDDVRAALATIEDQHMDLRSGSDLSSTFTHTNDVENSRKRPRGRPRKPSILPSSEEASSISDSPNEAVKRKPGRPSKTRSSSLSLPEVSSVTSRPTRGPGPSNLNSFSHDVEMSKKIPTQRRGRPRNFSEQTMASYISPAIPEKCGLSSKDGFLSITDNNHIPIPEDRVNGRGRGREILSATRRASPIGAFKPRQGQSTKPSLVISTNPPTPEIVKRSRGRPRNDVYLSSTPETPTRKRGRPRKLGSSPPFTNQIVISSGSDKRKPGRPRKEKSPLSTMSRNINVPINQRVGRTCKDARLTASASSPKSRTASVSSKGVHTYSIHHYSSSSSGESFDFMGLSDSDVSDEDFDQFLARIAKRLKAQGSHVHPNVQESRHNM